MGLHCAFDDEDPAIRAAIEAKLAAIAGEYRPLVARAQGIAQEVAQAIEGLVGAGSLSREAAFDTRYVPLPATDPQQYETAFTQAFEGVLPAIIEPPAERGQAPDLLPRPSTATVISRCITAPSRSPSARMIRSGTQRIAATSGFR